MAVRCFCLALFFFVLWIPLCSRAADDGEEMLLLYQEYESRFQKMQEIEELSQNGYEIFEEQVFPLTFESFGEHELYLVPALEKNWRRLALFVAD
ncbi:MAG: hypothetical protein K2P27_12210 [Lachnospiraceae bacterium]|nr:hypothetical protein [Lachnospiraceae bacterium]